MEALEKVEKILFIQTAFIGDAILSLPAISKLKEMNNNCLIDVICIPSTEKIFKAAAEVNDVIIFDKRGSQKPIYRLFQLAKDLKNKNYDKIYSSHRSFRTALLVLLSGVRETYGFDNSIMKYAYKNLINYELNKHEVQRNLDLIGYNYDSESWKIIPKIEVPGEVIQKISKFVDSNFKKENIIAIAPGTIWQTKQYPLEYYREVVIQLSKSGNSVLLIGSKNDKELCNYILEGQTDNIISVAGEFNIIESIEILTYCKLLVCNDSAPTHMAMAANIKALTIYCSTVPGFGFYPYNNGSKYLSLNDLECKPCGIHGHNSCPISTFDCGKNLSVDLVFNTIKKMISDN